MRIRQGYDAHKLVQDRDLILGGVNIPYEKGLLDHSDVGVLVHTVMDALLGAAALGDIEQHFPDADPAYKGISSIELLKKVGELLDGKGYAVENTDAIIMARRPKLAQYGPQMAANIADALHLDVSRVSVKVTTEGGLGFTGAGEGISPQATTLLTETADYCYGSKIVEGGCGGYPGCSRVKEEQDRIKHTLTQLTWYVPDMPQEIHLRRIRVWRYLAHRAEKEGSSLR